MHSINPNFSHIIKQPVTSGKISLFLYDVIIQKTKNNFFSPLNQNG